MIFSFTKCSWRDTKVFCTIFIVGHTSLYVDVPIDQSLCIAERTSENSELRTSRMTTTTILSESTNLGIVLRLSLLELRAACFGFFFPEEDAQRKYGMQDKLLIL